MLDRAPPEFGREQLVSLLRAEERILEIGPFTKPVVRGDNVKYFDVLNKAGLVARAEQKNYKYDNAPEIDFVSPVGDLSVVTEKFSACLSSHCIEHQPDLVKHLAQVASLLDAKGRYFIIAPDKRYCFDHFIPETTIADIWDGVGRTVHTIGNVIRHRALVTHNEPSRHWKEDHGAPRGLADPGFVQRAVKEFHDAGGGYVDVHAWQFTPASFRNLIKFMRELELTQFDCEGVYPTPFGRFEFCAILRLS